MGKIIFQLLSYLYLYDSGIPVPVRIRKGSRYTGVRRLALTYRGGGIPASDTTGKFAQSRYTGVRRHREVCAKAGIPASDVLRVNLSVWQYCWGIILMARTAGQLWVLLLVCGLGHCGVYLTALFRFRLLGQYGQKTHIKIFVAVSAYVGRYGEYTDILPLNIPLLWET